MSDYRCKLTADSGYVSEASVNFSWEMRKVELVLAECRKRGLAGRLELSFNIQHERDRVSGFLWVRHTDPRVPAYQKERTALMFRDETPEDPYPPLCPPEPPWEQAADVLRAAVLAADEAWIAELMAQGGRADD